MQGRGTKLLPLSRASLMGSAAMLRRENRVWKGSFGRAN